MKHLLLALLLFAATYADAQVKKVYNETIDPMAQIDSALVKANAEGKFVVCQIGGNWCPWCLRFADFIEKDDSIRQVVDENFVYIHVNYPRRNASPELLNRLGNPGRFGYPAIVVLRRDGNVLHMQDSSFLEEGEGYNKDKVLRFFNCWKPSVVLPQSTK